ncbi:SRPBCC family protein [Rhodopseudomonas palustris]|uniref:Carbon monoxide dehydrogenase n=1 Tax=Rhodopseudomonas palustris TaxID=1076 RepID=A0A418V0T1_RHOPL|nr:SRPBCC family protein [Rhodopseudomonas palustris]RJF69386.1 carbon monoxide dehydrogenase [Rhodopseudomonas palustris]
MQLDQSFEVGRTLDTVWRGLGDLPATASCIPGAEITQVDGNEKASGVFKVQLGPIKAAFAGDAEVVRDEATHSGTISGAGKDGKNATRVKALVKYQLHAVGDAATRIDLSVEYSISGPLAQFSRAGIVKEIAGSITKVFATNLEAMLAASASAPAAVPPAELPSSAPAQSSSTPPSAERLQAAAPPPSLNLGALMWNLLWQKIKGVFGKS